MIKFTYNNIKDASIGYMSFELNCDYHPRVSYKEDLNFCYKSKSVKILSAEVRELMIVCRLQLHYSQKFWKKAHDTKVQHGSYAPVDKLWFNGKYIKTKRNQKFETKFFRQFWLLYPAGKQVYYLELPKN